jgi:hypothetical protein
MIFGGMAGGPGLTHNKFGCPIFATVSSSLFGAPPVCWWGKLRWAFARKREPSSLRRLKNPDMRLCDVDQPHNLAKSVTVEQLLPIQRVANQGEA